MILVHRTNYSRIRIKISAVRIISAYYNYLEIYIKLKNPRISDRSLTEIVENINKLSSTGKKTERSPETSNIDHRRLQLMNRAEIGLRCKTARYRSIPLQIDRLNIYHTFFLVRSGNFPSRLYAARLRPLQVPRR